MEHLDKKKKVTIMIAIMTALLFAALNQTIVGTALPRIIAELGGIEYFSWVFTIYMLTSSITAILVGKLSDIYGRKPFIIIGILIFILGSFLCGLSTSIIQLIIYRGIQGLGGGMIISSAFTVVGDLFAPRERGRWQGLLTAVFGLASVFGPTLGGYIVDHAQWHWVFWIFLPFGLIALALIWFLFPSAARKVTEPVDYLGSLFLTLTIVPMLLAFSWAGTTYAWSSVQIIGLFLASIVALAIFIWIEKIAKSAILPLGLFKNSIFTVSNLIGFTMGAGMFGAIMFMPFFVQGVLGVSATSSGFITMPMTLSMVVASALSGQMITKTGKYKNLSHFGLLIMAVGLFSMSFMNIDTTKTVAVINMIVVGFGLGVGFPILTLAIQNAVDHKFLGVATASAQLFRQIGGTVGVSVMGTVMGHRMAQEMGRLSAASGVGDLSKLNPGLAQKLALLKNPQVLMDPEKLMQIQTAFPAELHEVFNKIIIMLREALSYALSGVFLAGGFVIVVALLLTFLLKEIPLRTSNKSGHEGNPPEKNTLKGLREQAEN